MNTVIYTTYDILGVICHVEKPRCLLKGLFLALYKLSSHCVLCHDLNPKVFCLFECILLAVIYLHCIIKSSNKDTLLIKCD